MVELVDSTDLGSVAIRCAGSSPAARTIVGDPSARLKNGKRLTRLPFFRLCSGSPPLPQRTRCAGLARGPRLKNAVRKPIPKIRTRGIGFGFFCLTSMICDIPSLRKEDGSRCLGQFLLCPPVLQAEDQSGDEGRGDVRRHVGSGQTVEAKQRVHQKQQRDQDQTLPQQGNENGTGFHTERICPYYTICVRLCQFPASYVNKKFTNTRCRKCVR